MATAGQQLVGLGQTLGTINSLFGGGGKTKTSTSQTSQTNVTEEGIQRIINQMLAGRGGVKDISGAARGAGLYNSTTEQQLLNDLNTRVAGEAARLSAPTTTTQNQVVDAPGMSIGGTLLPLAALAGLGQAGNIASAVGNLFSGAPSVSSAFQSGGTALGSGAVNLFNPGAQVGGNLLSSLEGLTAAEGVASAIPNLGGSIGDFLSGGTVPVAGNFLSGLLGDSDAVKDPMNLALSSIAAIPALGPAGLIAAPAAILGGSLFKNISIVCTALQARGLLDSEKYAKGQVYLAGLHKFTKLGYYWLAAEWADKIKQGDIATIAKCLPWAYSRTELIAKPTFWNHIKYFRGTLTRFIGQPMCFVIGALLHLADFTVDDVTIPGQLD